MSNLSFGIDLGTNNIRIYHNDTEDVLMEKNMIPSIPGHQKKETNSTRI